MLEISDRASHLVRLVWVAARALMDTPILNYISYATLYNAYRYAVGLSFDLNTTNGYDKIDVELPRVQLAVTHMALSHCRRLSATVIHKTSLKLRNTINNISRRDGNVRINRAVRV